MATTWRIRSLRGFRRALGGENEQRNEGPVKGFRASYIYCIKILPKKHLLLYKYIYITENSVLHGREGLLFQRTLLPNFTAF